MLEVINDIIYRAGTRKKAGWISKDWIYDDSGKKLCYVSEDTQTIYDPSGKKLVIIKGNAAYDALSGAKLDLDDSVQKITAIGFSNIYHIALSMFFAE
jgi:hypothetical protein